MDKPMTANEADRLNDWLKANGHTAEEANHCIKYIAGNTNDPRPQGREKAHCDPFQSDTVS